MAISRRNKIIVPGAILGIIIGVIVVGTAPQENREILPAEQLLERAIEFNYDDIFRNEQKYENQIIHLNGIVTVVFKEAEPNTYRYLLQTYCEPDSEDCQYVVVFYQGQEFDMGDKLQVFGFLRGTMNVEIGQDNTEISPVIAAVRVTCTSC